MSPTLAQMVFEAVKEHGGQATFAEIKDYVRNHFGPVNEPSLNCQANSCCVNLQSRVNYPENQKARVCQAGKGNDLLYKVGYAEFALYDPQLHGHWEIIAGSSSGKANERWIVREVQPGPQPQPQPRQDPPPPPPPPPQLKLGPAELGELRRQLMALLDQFDRKIGPEPLGKRIRRLTECGHVPRHVGQVMTMIVEYRNWAEYEHGILSQAQAEMVLSAWKVIKEWSGLKGHELAGL